MKRLFATIVFVLLAVCVALWFLGVMPRDIGYLLWVAYIVSSGVACGVVAWKTRQLRRQHRIFHYFGLVMAALCISTCNGAYALIQLIRDKGMVVFNDLPFSVHRSLIAQALVATTLWLLALYLFDKIDGNGAT